MITHRRLKWLGHVLRLNEETPARSNLNECIINKKLPIGRPKFTWLEGIKQDLKNVINFKDTTRLSFCRYKALFILGYLLDINVSIANRCQL